MHALTTRPIITTILISLSLMWSGLALGQGTTPHSAGVYLGFTDRADADFTFGGEYDYRFDRQWSAGAVVEYTPDVVLGDDFAVVLGTVNFRPSTVPRLKLTGGAGVEFKDVGGDDLKLRIGAGYDVFIEGPVSITPRVAIDFGDGDEDLILGVSAMYRF